MHGIEIVLVCMAVMLAWPHRSPDDSKGIAKASKLDWYQMFKFAQGAHN
jgi:hypothetical protein